jgi:DNA-directed RNA polymerase specialized sigma24 family protein
MLSTPDRLRIANRSSSARQRRGSSPAAVGTGRGSAVARRARLVAALARCSARDRIVLALMLVERLSTSEAADALGISVSRLRRLYGATLAELRSAWSGVRGSVRPRARRVVVGTIPLRKAV